MIWLWLAGSLVVVLVLGTVARLVRARQAKRIESPEAAADAADAALAGFRTAGAVVGADGTAALAVDGRGRVAVCKRSGARIAVREVAWSRVCSTPEGVLVDTGERRFGAVIVRGIDALDVRRLAPQPARA